MVLLSAASLASGISWRLVNLELKFRNLRSAASRTVLLERGSAEHSSFRSYHYEQKNAGQYDDEGHLFLVHDHNKILHDGGVFTLAYENQTKKKKTLPNCSSKVLPCVKLDKVTLLIY